MLAIAHARAERYDESAVIVVLDLDGLKAINDREGHLVGDLTIRVAGDVLVRVTRRPDQVARLGGDEFGIIAQPCIAQHAEVLVSRLQEALTAQGVRASIGWTAHHPERPIIETWAEADEDMYAAKERRRSARTDATV
jgi:diguanylate cyclase (GGDEF)-like protein